MLEQVLASRYRLIQPLVLGGFSQTYLAEDTHIPGQPHCVVKQLHPASNDSSFLEVARRLFKSEAETLQKVGKHSQIPSLLAYFEENKEFYLVQEYIHGTNLKDILPLGTCLPEQEVIAILQDCLGILEFVHSQGVIHRDIKPANLMRRQEDGKMVLLDFGAVKQIGVDQKSQLTVPTVVVGTQGFMPDEQLRGRPHFTSDLYALGMIGVQALTGLDPVGLERGDDDEIVWQPQVPCSLGTTGIISKMVRRDYRQRYQSAADVLTALKEVEPPSPSSSDSQSGLVANATTQVVRATDQQQRSIPQNETVKPVHSETQYNRPNSGKTVMQADIAQPRPEPITGPTEQVIPFPIEKTPKDGSAVDQIADPVNATNKPRFKGFKSTNVAVVSLILLLSGAAVGGFYLSKRASLATTLDQLESLYNQKKYEECINTAKEAIANPEIPNIPIKGPMAQCQLGTAQVRADQTRFVAAIGLASEIPSGNPHYKEAQQKIETWAAKILAYATKTYEEQGKLNDALAAARLIPKTTTVAEEAARQTQKWKASNAANESLLKAARTDLDQGLSEDAIAKAEQVKEPKYWQQKADQIKQEAQKQIASRPPPAPVRRTYPSNPAPSYSAPAPRQQRAYTPPQRTYTSPQRQAPAPRRQAPAPRRQAPAPQPAPQKPVVQVCPGPLCSE